MSCYWPRISDRLRRLHFDVDGTLVKGSGKQAEASAHAQAFSYAVGTKLGSGNKPVRPVAEALAPHEYHGSTDGLILLRLARAELGVEDVSEEQLEDLMDTMYDFIAALPDEEVAKGIQPLPGVLDHLERLAELQKKEGDSSNVACGLVTGNVEGIARRKMRAVGVYQTGALAPPAAEQLQKSWRGAEQIGFMGGFGSCFCSRNINDFARNHLDRGEQIAIAARRCQSTLKNDKVLSRVVHVGDAPADVLAAKAFAHSLTDNQDDMCVGMVAVATGSYGAEELQKAAGEPRPGRWEPVILEDGMADKFFLEACGL